MKYLDLIEELSNQTANVYTLRRLEEIFKKNKSIAKKEIHKVYDIMTTLRLLSAHSWHRIKKRVNQEDGLKEEAFIRFCQFHTMIQQTKILEEMIQVCSCNNRYQILQDKIQESLKLSQDLFDRIPLELKIYQEKVMADMKTLRPQIFNSRLIFHKTTLAPQRKETKDFIRSKDDTGRIVQFDDLIPHAFYYGDNIRRCGSISALMRNNKKIEELGFENDF